MKKNMKKYVWILLAICFPMGFIACSDSDEPQKEIVEPNPSPEPEDETTKGYACVNFFGYNVMNDVYLWKEEIDNGLSTWKTSDEPIGAVAKVRYKDASGKDIDKWTMMTNEYESMVGSTDGVSNGTYGCNYKFYLKEEGSDAVVAFVIYTYPDSPAEKAGLKRGDVVLTIGGKELNQSNYTDLYYAPSVEIGLGRYQGNGVYTSVEKTAKMSAVAMYENPIVATKVFDCAGKKVGYLAYTSFTFESSVALIDVCKEFKAQGVTELILDLRYNGGGYVFTENVLASMLAPEAEVKAKSILSTEVWNDSYMDYYKKHNKDLNTYFETQYKQEHNKKMYNLNTADANIGLNKIYALVGEGTASASESVLVCLMPYMDIEIIGSQTHGKYCSGIMWSGEEWYQDVEDSYKDSGKNFATEAPQYADWKKYMKNWGIYVMISMYADKDGNNPCMPDGLLPDVEADDFFEESYPLGDEREAMLNVALQRAGKPDLVTRAVSRSLAERPQGEELCVRRGVLDGKRIFTDEWIKPHLLK